MVFTHLGHGLAERIGRFSGDRAGRLTAVVLVAAVSVAATSYLAAVDPNESGHYPTCPFLALTGLYCPGCGSLRAVHALAHGQIGEAVDHNVLTVLAVPYLVIAYVLWARRVVFERPLRRLAPPWVIWLLLAVVVTFWVLRNIPYFSWLAP